MIKDNFEIQNFPSLEQIKFSENTLSAKSNRVCIITEEIVGPVPNGGIATTYAELAKFLVEWGFEVTVLFTKGRKSQVKNIDYWIKSYEKIGIKLVPLPMVKVNTDNIWTRRWYSVLEFLKSNACNFDIIHVSEWRGMAYYCLLAKHLGIYFDNLSFIVKASSPHIWNRHYGLLPIENKEFGKVMYAEQRSIELADLVVGGSAHLLSFMKHVGYQMPETRCFVQPNIIDNPIKKIASDDQKQLYGFGEKVAHLVFFGRLEYRKGITIFLDALELLSEQQKLPEKISFLGKEGGDLPIGPPHKPVDYIKSRTDGWPIKVDVITHLDQPAAMKFLSQEGILAVMPSLIENSSLAVYEALLLNIPFLASEVGGTPELVHEEDLEFVIFDGKPTSLADKIAQAQILGTYRARPKFENEKNIQTWRNFHDALSQQNLIQGTCGVGEQAYPNAKIQNASGSKLCLCAYFTGELSTDDAKSLLGELEQNLQNPEHAELYLIQPNRNLDISGLNSNLNALKLIDNSLKNIGECLNEVLDYTTCNTLIFYDGNKASLKSGFELPVSNALNSSNYKSFSAFFLEKNGLINPSFIPDLYGFIERVDEKDPEFLIVNKAYLGSSERFLEIQDHGWALQEFILRMTLNQMHEIIPHPVFTKIDSIVEPTKQVILSKEILKRPIYETMPLQYKKLFLGSHFLPSFSSMPRVQRIQTESFIIFTKDTYFYSAEPKNIYFYNRMLTFSLKKNGRLKVLSDSKRLLFTGGNLRVYINGSKTHSLSVFFKPLLGCTIDLKKLKNLSNLDKNILEVRIFQFSNEFRCKMHIEQVQQDAIRLSATDDILF